MLTTHSHQQDDVSVPNSLFIFAISKTTSMSTLMELQQFIADCKKKHHNDYCPFPLVRLNQAQSLEQAIQAATQVEPSGLVIATGFSTTDIRNRLSQLDTKALVQVISQPEPGTERYHQETASILESRRLTRVTSIQNGLRKALLKKIASNLGEIKIITSQNDMPDYFQLRFHVWQQMGYLPAHSPLNKDQWEVDRFERFSIPIGLFDRQNRLIACARLVQSFGKENIPHIKAIIKTLQTYRKPYALEAFSLTGKVEQPFDILCEFKGFWDYYRNFVKQNQTVAEVSRIIVHPDRRGLGLAEVLVDSIVTVAQQHDIDVLLLACRESLQPLYEKCGFKAVPNLVSGQFLTIPEKSVVMKRTLK